MTFERDKFGVGVDFRRCLLQNEFKGWTRELTSVRITRALKYARGWRTFVGSDLWSPVESGIRQKAGAETFVGERLLST
jgi:hypothetical protein